MAEIVLKSPTEINDVRDVDCFLAPVDPASDRIVLDFTDTRFIRPVGIVSFLATLERIAKQAGESKLELRLPLSEDVCVYLLQTGIFDLMREYGFFTGPQPEEVIPEQSPARPMIPCNRFRTESDIDALADQMEVRFQTEFTGLASLLQPCHVIFSELVLNAVYHAESDGGYVLAQQYNYSAGPVVDIAVADCGIGVRNSLSKNPDLALIDSDSDAIKLALQEGVTSLRQSNRGYGLNHVTDDVMKGRDRRMVMRSGYGIITQGNGNTTQDEHDVYYPGTIVNVTIPCAAE